MKIFNRVVAGFAALVLTATTFAVPDLVPTRAQQTQVTYHHVTSRVAHAVLVSFVNRVEARR